MASDREAEALAGQMWQETCRPDNAINCLLPYARLLLDAREALRPLADQEECGIGVLPETADELHLVGCGECGTILLAREVLVRFNALLPKEVK